MQTISIPAINYNQFDLMQMNAYMMGAPYPNPMGMHAENKIPSLNSIAQFQHNLINQGKTDK